MLYYVMLYYIYFYTLRLKSRGPRLFERKPRSTSKFQSFVEEELIMVKQQMSALVDVFALSSSRLGRMKSRDPPKHLDL